MISIIPIVLAGGSGTSLWPLSRRNYPKSLIKLEGDTTLLQTILTQIKLITHTSVPLIIGNVEYETAIVDQVAEINVEATLLLENQSHNTAAAVAMAAQYALTKTDNPLLLILSIDHSISNVSQFAKMIAVAAKAALNEQLVTFGVKPVFPATTYGYIQKGSKLSQSSGYVVKQFKEKPNSKKALDYLNSGEYYWNSGIFLFLASVFLEELAAYSPQLLQQSKKVLSTMQQHNNSIYLNTHLMKNCGDLSIDQAILEKTKRAVVFPFKGGWHDLGNWNALYEIAKKDNAGNAMTENVLGFDTKNSYLYSTQQLLVTSGISHLLVIVTKDAVLVAHRNKTQDIKKIVAYLMDKNYGEATLAPVIYQSWGHYEVTEQTSDLEIKHFFINPQKEFSSKVPPHCSIDLIVVWGKGEIAMGKEIKVLFKNESIKIPANMEFKLINREKTQLHFIEISCAYYSRN